MQKTFETKEALLAELVSRCEKLAMLLRHPEEGLISWVEIVADHAQFITDWWDGKLVVKGKDNAI
jgi:hypothetical protein